MNEGERTISRNSRPTVSSPEPPSSTSPRASSSASENASAKEAKSSTLVKMIFASSTVMAGPHADDDDAADESDTVESVRDDEPDEPGGVAGACANGAGWPRDALIDDHTTLSLNAILRTQRQGDVDVADEREVGCVCSFGGEQLEEGVCALRSHRSDRRASGSGRDQRLIVLFRIEDGQRHRVRGLRGQGQRLVRSMRSTSRRRDRLVQYIGERAHATRGKEQHVVGF